ncbi:F-box domain,Leucine-rich repeat domain, L domain-like [Cinara cedri]|uniref:F-box domain,Leucine-rich repeat domain, L domain-like n=1 Tax=Cinara cedri TaxID=506608 RepID=A0A5E4NJR7_9HEMI|nr:F-box domain,Leucine-rich repeat domain, L domain-like [Cinara cedri]
MDYWQSKIIEVAMQFWFPIIKGEPTIFCDKQYSELLLDINIYDGKIKNLEQINLQEPMKKVKDHDHLTGKYRGAAYSICNLNYKVPRFIPVFFHKISGYDAHLFIKELELSKHYPEQLDLVKLELELFRDIDMYLMFEQGIREGLSQCSIRYSKASNKYFGEKRKEKTSTKYLLDLDINILYGWESNLKDQSEKNFTGFTTSDIEKSEKKLMTLYTEINVRVGFMHGQSGGSKEPEVSNNFAQKSNSKDHSKEDFTGFTTGDIEKSEKKLMTSYSQNNIQIGAWNSLNLYLSSMKHVFTYLHTKDLVSASKVCNIWKCCALDNYVWQNIRLKNTFVCDWDKLIDTINSRCVISLDTRGMLIPSNIYEFERFWLKFSLTIHNAKKLKALKLYRCPINIVCYVMHFLQQLEVLEASLKNPYVKTNAQKLNGFITINIDNVSQMKYLRKLKIKCPTGIKLISTPKLTFANLTNLKTLSLTSIQSFSKDIYTSLRTVSTDLEVLEIGDCDCLKDDFPKLLKKLINLKSLRLENCYGRWENYSKDYFDAIRSMKKLKTLELINISFNDRVEEELQKCNGITALLIIPSYEKDCGRTIRHLLDCLEKLSNTLTHVVWGITHELIYTTGLFVEQYQQNQHNVNYKPDDKQKTGSSKHIPILDSRKPKPLPEGSEILNIDEANLSNCGTNSIVTVLKLETLLKAAMVNTKTKIIQIRFSETTGIYIREQFDIL